MLSAAQMRAGRALLGWSQAELAEASTVSLPTIKRMESVGPGRSAADTVHAVQSALEAAGVAFLDEGATVDGGPGVRLTKIGAAK